MKGRAFRRRLIAVLLLTGASVGVVPATSPVAKAAGETAQQLADAIATGVSVTGSYVVLASPNAVAVRTDTVATMPTAGSGYAVMSTGDAGILTAPNSSGSAGTDLGGGNVRGNTDFDVTILRIDFVAPSSANCLLGVDFRFLTEEYPEFVGSEFNDAFVIEVDQSTWTTNGSAINAPGNIAFDPAGNPISVNAAGATSVTAEEAAGTTFDGATPLLRAASPINPGPHSLFLSLFDQGDRILDSAVLVDNLRVGTVADISQCVPGAVVPEPPPPTGNCFGISAADVAGTPPTYRNASQLASFPNSEAACNAVWVPTLDEGFTPQGLALVGDGSALISGYDSRGADRCRIVRVDLVSGALLGRRDFAKKSGCSHGGGIQYDGSGRLWLADTHSLFELNPGTLFASTSPITAGEFIRNIRLVDLHGSFLAGGTNDRLWVGDHDAARLYEFRISTLISACQPICTLSPSNAVTDISLGSGPQGGAFHAPNLWASHSKSTCGVLTRGLSTRTRFGFGPGVEEIEFAADGSLWAVFEAGANHPKFKHAPFFPVVARFDINKLVNLHESPTCNLGT